MDRNLIWLGIGFVTLAVSATAQTNVTNGNNGTSGTVPVYNGAASVTNSPISVSGSNVGIGTTSPNTSFGLTVDSVGIFARSPGNNSGIFLTPSNGNFGLVQAVDYGNDAVAPLIFQQFGGNIGIGTTSPDAILDSTNGANRFELTSSSVTNSSLMNAGNINDVIRINAPYSADPTSGSNAGAAWGIRFIGTTDPNNNRNTTTKGPAIFAVSEDTGAGYNRANGLALYTNTMDTAAAERVRISNSGNVGIGTTTPGSRLEVNGNIALTSGSGASMTFADGTTQSTAWTGTTCGGDYAESVDVTGDRTRYEPGDVLVIDPNDEGKFLKSVQPYSTFVTGIYSTKPGLVGRRQLTDKSHMKDEVPMAMTGIVPTKVTAENGPIQPGDLLVTSSRLGYAMKGTDRSQMLGAVIGKALGHLDSGTGVIEVVVTLQ